jgi:hypothetical protein
MIQLYIKSQFRQTAKKTLRGKLKDNCNSSKRMILSNIIYCTMTQKLENEQSIKKKQEKKYPDGLKKNLNNGSDPIIF